MHKMPPKSDRDPRVNVAQVGDEGTGREGH